MLRGLFPKKMDLLPCQANPKFCKLTFSFSKQGKYKKIQILNFCSVKERFVRFQGSFRFRFWRNLFLVLQDVFSARMILRCQKVISSLNLERWELFSISLIRSNRSTIGSTLSSRLGIRPIRLRWLCLVGLGISIRETIKLTLSSNSMMPAIPFEH